MHLLFRNSSLPFPLTEKVLIPLITLANWGEHNMKQMMATCVFKAISAQLPHKKQNRPFTPVLAQQQPSADATSAISAKWNIS